MTLGRRADAAARRFGASVACAGSAFFGCASSAPVGPSGVGTPVLPNCAAWLRKGRR